MKKGRLSDGEKMVWAATYAVARNAGQNTGMAVAVAQNTIYDLREYIGDGEGTWVDEIVGVEYTEDDDGGDDD